MFLLASPLILSSCEPFPVNPPVNVSTAAKDVLVLCEGNFMWGNAQMDLLRMDSMRMDQDIYRMVNGTGIGDVLQHGILLGNSYFLSVNNSGKVVKIDARNLRLKQMNPNLSSPRYLMAVSGNIWVTDLYSNKISLLDTGTLALNKTIDLKGWTEQMVAWHGDIFVANYAGGVHGFTTDGIRNASPVLKTDSTTQYLVVDNKNRLWAMSTKQGKGKLYQFASPNQENPSLVLDLGADVSRLTINPAGDTLYFLTPTAVKKMDVNTKQLSDIQVFASGFQQAYALGISPDNQFLMVGDAKDFVSNGKLSMYSMKTGSLVKTFSTGVNPSAFVFKP